MTSKQAKILAVRSLDWANAAEERGMDYRRKNMHKQCMREFNLETVLRRYVDALVEEYPEVKEALEGRYVSE